MKRLKQLIVLLVLIVLIVVLLRNTIVKHALPPLAQALAGVNVAVRDVAIGLRVPQIALWDVQVMNPPGFPAEPMLTAPEVALRYAPATLLQQTVRVPELRLHVSRVVIGRNADGALNVRMPAGGGGNEPAPTRKNVAIERLRLTIDSVVLKDYSVTPPRELLVPLHIDEDIYAITNHAQVAAAVVERAMRRVPVDALAQQGLQTLTRALGQGGRAVNVSNVQAIIRDAGSVLKSLFNKKK